LLFDSGNVICDAPKHLLDRFGGLAIIATTDIALHQYLPGIIG
jgi:hypothetical protein